MTKANDTPSVALVFACKIGFWVKEMFKIKMQIAKNVSETLIVVKTAVLICRFEVLKMTSF